MTKPMVRIHDLSIDKIIDREMNDEEFAEHQANIDANQVKLTEAQAQAAAKSALLDRLGITADEAKLLLS
jgi:hypothetical protein